MASGGISKQDKEKWEEFDKYATKTTREGPPRLHVRKDERERGTPRHESDDRRTGCRPRTLRRAPVLGQPAHAGNVMDAPAQLAEGGAANQAEEWVEAFDANSQRNYYVNKRTKRSTWSRPMLGNLASIERFFHYIDKKGNQQGPFTESKMLEWFDQGYFKPHVKCKCDTDSEWSTIGKLFGKEEDEDSDGGGTSDAGDGGEAKQGHEIDVTRAVILSNAYSVTADDEDVSETAEFKRTVERSTVRLQASIE